MTRRTRSAGGSVFAVVAAALAMAPSAAADVPPAVAVNGLNNPRGLALGPDGSLYFAQAGRGGSICNKKKTQCMGATGSIGRLLPSGAQVNVARGLPSMAGGDGTFAVGTDDVAVAPDGTVYSIITSAGPKPPKALPQTLGRYLGRVIRVRNKRVERLAAVDRIEFAQNPDGAAKESDPYSIAYLNGKLYVADAAGNDLLEVSGQKARVLTVFPNTTGNAQSVPTVVRAGPDGALYVGELTGEKAPNGSARIWRVDPSTGQKTVYAGGLSRVTGLTFAKDGSLFVTELTKDFARFTPGDLVRIPPGGGAPQLFANLLSPAGVVIHGNTLYVAVSTVAAGTPAAGGPAKGLVGKVVKFPV